MYLSNIKLWNFRKFGSDAGFDLDKPNLNLDFNKELNILIGENDSGKTAIIDAIKYVLRTHSYEWIQISEDDFYKNSLRFRIELRFESLADEEAKHFTEWLGWEGEGENATPFLRLIYDVKRSLERIFPSDITAGVDNEGNQLTAEARDYLKITYLKPLRDANNELIPKRNSRLSQIFHSHEAFKGKDEEHYLIGLFKSFNISVEKYFDGKKEDDTLLVDDQNGKELKRKIDEYIQDFYDKTKKTEITTAQGSLKNILEKLELTISGEVNLGLGTLNRLFIASELLHLNKNNWDGLRLGLIEELEAHLHPQAQMQMIESLQKEANIQLILTTHSPNLASKVHLENLIVCHHSAAFPMGKGKYTKLDDEDYVFLERFLDVTKANLFFAKGIIMVEGWAEEILIPTLARKMKSLGIVDKDLTEAGVSVVNVGGTAFLRYSKIFLRKDNPLMDIPVAIITDVDVTEYEKSEKSIEDGKTKYEYIKRDSNQVLQASKEKVEAIKGEFEDQKVMAFVAPHWTLEYSIFKSTYLSKCFQEIVKQIHPGIDEHNLEQELAKKLINKTLKKTDIAYKLAQLLEDDNKSTVPEILVDNNDEATKYLIEAIKYACEN